MDTQKFEVAIAESGIVVKREDIILSNGKLNGGRYIIDTISFKVIDIVDPVLYAQFSAHLADDDFVFREKDPEAFLDITSVMDNHIEGDLNIKGIMHPIDLDVLVNVSGDKLTVAAKLVVARTKTGYRIPL